MLIHFNRFKIINVRTQNPSNKCLVKFHSETEPYNFRFLFYMRYKKKVNKHRPNSTKLNFLKVSHSLEFLVLPVFTGSRSGKNQQMRESEIKQHHPF